METMKTKYFPEFADLYFFVQENDVTVLGYAFSFQHGYKLNYKEGV